MSSRRVCPSCKANYNLISQAPVKEGICDHCGTRIEQRKDDSPDAIHKRFEAFYQETFPLIEFFKNLGVLQKVDASLPIDTLAKQIYSLYYDPCPIES